MITSTIGSARRPSPPQFRDIRNQRPSTAEQKAVALLRLGQLLKRVHAQIRDGSVQRVREWKACHAAALKVAGNSRSSVTEITSACHSLERWGE